MKSKRLKAAKALEKQKQNAASCPYRPKYHFLPPANWMNDPNGTLFFNGEYHLFYQFNPYKPHWGRIHWGHAKSKDLVQWEHLPIALTPDPGPKEMHCFSGCCVIANDGKPTIFYTSISALSFLTRVRRFAEQWVATSDPTMITWEKDPQNPVLSENKHHPGEQIRNWRDPYIWKEEETWYMVIAGQQKGEKFGSVYLYRSKDLSTWETLGRLYKGEPALGNTWECPNYIRLGEKYLLIISPFGQVIYSVGAFQNHQHHAKHWHIFDHGKDFYATNTFLEGQDRVVLVGWIKVKGKAPWAGCLSLPREIQLNQDEQLAISPIPELKKLRHKHRRLDRSFEAMTELAGSAPYFGECVEIKARYELKSMGTIGFDLVDDVATHKIELDLPSKTMHIGQEQAELQFLEGHNEIMLHIFIDKSIIEIFINDRETFTTCFYPQLAEYHALKISPFFIQFRGSVQIDFWTLHGTAVEEIKNEGTHLNTGS